MDSKDIDRMVTIGELSAILAHEIKNPMNSIIINLEVLKSSLSEAVTQSDNPSAERSKKYLNVIEGEIRRLDKVIKGFLDFANPEQTTKVKFNLNRVIREIRDLMILELENNGIQLKLELEDELPPVLGSSDQIKQAIINLLLNALQATGSGGEIHIRSYPKNGNVVVSISDTGKGMSNETLREIFKPYFTTKEKGSGLGLSIVHRVIREHGGEVDVESKEGKGTSFVIQLPALEVSNENGG